MGKRVKTGIVIVFFWIFWVALPPVQVAAAALLPLLVWTGGSRGHLHRQ